MLELSEMLEVCSSSCLFLMEKRVESNRSFFNLVCALSKTSFVF